VAMLAKINKEQYDMLVNNAMVTTEIPIVFKNLPK